MSGRPHARLRAQAGSTAGDFSTVPELCEALCPFPIAPVDPFVHRSGWSGEITNVPGNEVVGALNCLVPQGINGCEYGSPLEAMLRALDPAASWNQGEHPFLRPDAMLAIAIVSDGYDCSVQAPDGYAHFSVPAPSPAICWNAGVDCGTPDAEGVYADCTTVDGDVLHPIGRYSDFLDALVANGKPVVMLDLLGVPSAGAEPIYRDWREGVYPVGDLLPGEQTSAADKQFEFGIGPACVGHDELGELTNQALPDVRMTRLCESFDADGQVRCCIESSCEGDYTGAIGCLTGVIQTAVELD